MFYGQFEEVARERVADHERRMSRLLLEREARVAAAEARSFRPSREGRRQFRLAPWRQPLHSDGHAK